MRRGWRGYMTGFIKLTGFKKRGDCSETPALPGVVLMRPWNPILELGGGGHFGNEPVVELFGRIVTGGFELCLEGGNFDEPRKVTGGPAREGDMRDIAAGDFHISPLHPKALDIGHFVPRF